MSTPVYFPAAGNPVIPAGQTSLAPLLLACFDSTEIDLEWTTPNHAVASFNAKELPPETVVPGAETLGVTIGKLPDRAWLYEFIRVFPAATVVERFTSYERDLVLDGNTYSAKRINHGQTKQGIALDADELTFEVDGLDVAPLLDAALLRLEVPLIVVLHRAEIVGVGLAGNATVAWTGEVSTSSVQAKHITSKAISAGTIYDRKVPRFYLQPGCNHAVFSVGCGLDPVAWAHSGIMSDPGTPGWPFVFSLASLSRFGGAVITAENAFAGGWLEAGSGAAMQRIPILASTVVFAGTTNVTLSRDPSPWIPASGMVKIYPGCDGRSDTCQNRFNNFLNFGAHPFVPPGNPSLIKLSDDAGGGKK